MCIYACIYLFTIVSYIDYMLCMHFFQFTLIFPAITVVIAYVRCQHSFLSRFHYVRDVVSFKYFFLRVLRLIILLTSKSLFSTKNLEFV